MRSKDLDRLETTASAQLRLAEIKNSYDFLEEKEIPHQLKYAIEGEIVYFEAIYVIEDGYQLNIYKENGETLTVQPINFGSIKSLQEYLRSQSIHNKRYRDLLRSDFIKQHRLNNPTV